jgi:hypothetical protein
MFGSSSCCSFFNTRIVDYLLFCCWFCFWKWSFSFWSNSCLKSLFLTSSGCSCPNCRSVIFMYPGRSFAEYMREGTVNTLPPCCCPPRAEFQVGLCAVVILILLIFITQNSFCFSTFSLSQFSNSHPDTSTPIYIYNYQILILHEHVVFCYFILSQIIEYGA